MRSKTHDLDPVSAQSSSGVAALSPGKRTLTAKLARFARGTDPVQAATPAAGPARAEQDLMLIAHDLPATGGAPLPGAVQAKMSTAFGADFSSVRVHQDDRAGAIGAQAFASGESLHFAPGQYDPDTESGQSLIGHELAHVVQQRAGRVVAPAQGSDLVIDDALEREADDLGARAARGEIVAAGAGGTAAAGLVQGKDAEAPAPAAEQASRTVKGGGYTYEQFADGTIKILAGPTGVGVTLPVGHAMNTAITKEIGAFPAREQEAPADAQPPGECPVDETPEPGMIPSLEDIVAGIGGVFAGIGEIFFGEDPSVEPGEEPGECPVDDTPAAEVPAIAPGEVAFDEPFEVVDPKALIRNSAGETSGATVPQGTVVFIAKAEGIFVQVVTAEDAEAPISAADDVWIKSSNLGGTGADVGLGNEKTDEEDKKSADELRDGLPPGRSPGASPYKWVMGGGFQASLEGKSLSGTLMSKVYKLLQWAIENDMVVGDINFGEGVRGPKTAHRMCVAWEIVHRADSEKKVTFDDVKALPGGKDSDGNEWYQEGWTWEQVQKNARDVRASSSIAAAGYEYGNASRAPLPLSTKPGQSRHCTGNAVDVNVAWRKPGADASTNEVDVWAWEEIYKQFGLHRPLHKDLQGNPKMQEEWHIEETDKVLESE